MNKVLIIDDDKELCTLIKRSIQRERGAAKIKGNGISACYTGRYDARYGWV